MMKSSAHQSKILALMNRSRGRWLGIIGVAVALNISPYAAKKCLEFFSKRKLLLMRKNPQSGAFEYRR